MTLHELERESIRAFVRSAADEGYLSGRVLDYGCGKQPYRPIVEAAAGEYIGFDSASFPGSVVSEEIGPEEDRVLYPFEEYDAILCTQVVQYLPLARNSGYTHHWPLILWEWKASLAIDGLLVMTYPTNWPEVEPEDLHRFTKAGMARLLTEAGFTIVRHEVRGYHDTKLSYASLALGYGVVARA
jgi:hypothetical protein